MHFFEKANGTTTINLRTANRKNHECNVRLDLSNMNGHKMNMFGLSNQALIITYDVGTEELQLTSTNGGPLSFYQKHTGRAWQLKKEEMSSLGNGDEIRFAGNSDKGPPAYSAI